MSCIALKATTADDYEEYYKIRCSPSDIYWNGYTNKPDKKKFRELFLQRLGDAPLIKPEDRRLYLIQLIDGNVKNVGFVQLIKRIDGIDIGYTVIEEYQRHGYATKALLMGIDLAKKFNREIYVQIRDDNEASKRVAIKCGFIQSDIFIVKNYPKCGDVNLRKYFFEKSVL